MGLFILVYLPQSNVSIEKDKGSLQVRINTLNGYVDELETEYFELVLRASAKKSLISLAQLINQTNTFIPNVQVAFAEAMINGTYGGVDIDSITGLNMMTNNTLINWSNFIINTANEAYNVNTTISINNITINQSKPWTIDATVNLDVTVVGAVAKWVKENISIATFLSIEGLYDPYYLVNTGGDYGKTIKESGVRYDEWNITKLRGHIRNGTYLHRENSEAPSYLMRFTNDIRNSSCCGIESVVDPNKIESSQAKDQDRSYVDYHFWDNTFINDCELIFNITNEDVIPEGGIWDEFEYFKLDLNNTLIFNVTDQDAVRMLFDC